MPLGKKPLTSRSSWSSRAAATAVRKKIFNQGERFTWRDRDGHLMPIQRQTHHAPLPPATALKGATEKLDGHKENAILRGGHNECVKVYCSRKEEKGEKSRKLAGIPKGALHIYAGSWFICLDRKLQGVTVNCKQINAAQSTCPCQRKTACDGDWIWQWYEWNWKLKNFQYNSHH